MVEVRSWRKTGKAESPTRRVPCCPPRVRVRWHERVRGLSACLGAAIPGQRLAGRLGGGRSREPC